MKRNQLICLFAVISLGVISCKKESNSTHETNQQVYLSKVVFIDPDTSTIPSLPQYYHYDNYDRLQSVVTTRLGFTPSGSVYYLEPDSLIYYYNAADTLPFKAVHYNNGTFLPAEYFTYDNQARVIHRGWTDAGYAELFYTYLPNQITVSGPPMGNIYTLAYDGNNITQNISVTINSPWPKTPDTLNTLFTGLQNPFNLVNINRHVPDIPAYSNNQELVFSKNAPLQIKNIRQGLP
jgi:hypothetical protein